MQVIILAQGLSSRWEQPAPYEYKHLIKIGGKTILERTIDQVIGYNVFPIVIAPGEYSEHINYNISPLTYPGKTLFHGISATKDYWKTEQTIFLLGDVIFSKDMMNMIFTPHTYGKILFGRGGMNFVTGKQAGEIFALSIKQSVYDQFFGMLRQNLNKDEGGRLSTLFDMGYPFTGIRGDWTDDIDSPKEYNEFFEYLERCVENETEEKL